MVGGSNDPRVLMVDVPQLPRELVERALAAEDNVTLVGVVRDVKDLAAIVASTRANFLIVGAENSALPDQDRALISTELPPDTMVMPVDGRDVTLMMVRCHSRKLDDLSAGELVAVIKRSVSERRSA